MKATLVALVAGAGLMVAGAANAAMSQDDALALAKKSGCLNCHALDKNVVGPAWKDVGAKYKGDKGAEAKLIEKVKKGGSGNWGTVPMIPNSPAVSDDNIKALVEFVLTLG